MWCLWWWPPYHRHSCPKICVRHRCSINKGRKRSLPPLHSSVDVMLCGGSDATIIPIGLGGFVACKALSQRNTNPTKALHPWDINRDGFVMGEGAGVLLLEDLEHTKVQEI
ncbi:hypothetical protein HN51_050402 [Arachis hypogaea]